MKKRKVKYSRVLILILVLIIIVALVIFIFSDIKKTSDTSYGYDLDKFVLKNGLMTYKDSNYKCTTGIDVSDHNGDINWKKVKKDGIDFAMIRVGYRGAQEGILHDDENYQTNIEQAIKNKIDVGVYFFSSAINTDEIDEEVTLILDHIKGYKIKYPIVFDMEYYASGGRIDDLSKEEKTELTLYFCQKIEADGYTPMIYGNYSWLYDSIDLERLSNYALWYAAYQDKPAMEDHFDMWQYTNVGIVDGIDGDVDINLYIEEK